MNIDNSKDRLVDVFFYGLYMDEEILKLKSVIPRNQRKALIDGYKLRIGKMATLLRDNNSQVSGLVYSLTHKEIDLLYKDSNLTEYVSEAISALIDDRYVCVLCCNLLNPPLDEEFNSEYYEKLKICMKKYNFTIPKNV